MVPRVPSAFLSRCPTGAATAARARSRSTASSTTAGREPPAHARPVGAPRDDQPRLGARGHRRRRVLLADLTRTRGKPRRPDARSCPEGRVARLARRATRRPVADRGSRVLGDAGRHALSARRLRRRGRSRGPRHHPDARRRRVDAGAVGTRDALPRASRHRQIVAARRHARRRLRLRHRTPRARAHRDDGLHRHRRVASALRCAALA